MTPATPVGMMLGAWFAVEQPGARLPKLEHDPEQVRRLAHEILSRPEFRPAPRPWLLRLLDAFTRLINDALNRLGRGAGSVAGLLLVAAIVGLAVVVATRVVRRLPPDPARALDTEDVTGRSPVDWRAEAARHEAAGRWRDALRCRYRSLVAELAGRGLVEEIPGRTSGEYRLEVAAAVPAVAGEFGDATDMFERAWYGDLPTGPADGTRFAELAGRVEAGVA